jgi:two-component system KDP operon response regulator KdpE
MNADPSKPVLLVIADETQLRRLMRLYLEEAGYLVRAADSGPSGLEDLARETPDGIVLDLDLSGGSGVDVLGALREQNSLPVLVLSASGEEGRMVTALDAGADDYLTKPFGRGEFLARLRALLRRIKPAVAANAVRFGPIEVDLARRHVAKEGRAVKLTSMEYALLQMFITHRDKALTHRQILCELWGPKAEGQIHYLRTYIMRLRRKLENEVDAPKFFQTESGIGYRFVTQP